MRKPNPVAAVGVFLILLGLLLLLETLGLLRSGAELAVAAAFALGGAAFLWGFVSRCEWWWSAIPGMALLGIGLLIGYTTLAGGDGGELAASLFLGTLGAGFFLVYLRLREHWWAIIPGGVLLTLALTVGLEPAFDKDEATVAVLFLGLALTFVLVYLAPNPEGRMTWAPIPAVILAVIGTLILAGSAQLLGYIWPLALMAGGLLLLLKTMSGGGR